MGQPCRNQVLVADDRIDDIVIRHRALGCGRQLSSPVPQRCACDRLARSMPQLEDEASATDLQKKKVRTQKDERVRIKVRVSSYLCNWSPTPEKTRATQRQRDRERISKDGECRRRE